MKNCIDSITYLQVVVLAVVAEAVVALEDMVLVEALEDTAVAWETITVLQCVRHR
jgi:hypothetical protein